MDPLSIISGCAGLITAISSLSISISTFVRSCREARSDLDRVSRELHSLQTVLELIEEDAKDDTKPFPPTIQHHVSGIVSNCGSVVLEVETCIKKYGDGRVKSRAAWAINGQGDMEKLRSSLEAHKSALELALDMISLSLTKDIKTDTTEIRNDTPAIKDDTALILQEIAQLQARLPDTAAAPKDYILQKFLEDMVTYTEKTLDVDMFYSDGMSSRALPIVDEHDHNSPKSPRYDLPISGSQDPVALVASQLDSTNPGDSLKNGINYPASPESHNHGHGHWPRLTRENIPQRPKGPGPVSSWPEVFYDKEVALANDPQAPRSSALASDSRNEETKNQIAPSFAWANAFDPLWREPYGDYLRTQYPDFASRYVNLIREQQQMPHQTAEPPPVLSKEDDMIISPFKYQETSKKVYSIQRFRGNVVLDLPVPDRILNIIPYSAPLGQDEYMHCRFSFITCPPEMFGAQNYTLRATLFAKPRQTQFILVVQANPNDADFALRWNFIHDSIVYAQQKFELSGTLQEFWKRVIVHLHLTHGTEWGSCTGKHPLNVLESIAAKQTMDAKITSIRSEDLYEPIREDSFKIGEHRAYALMSEV
ncbi:hypothetical protein ACJA88_005712 [Fusarium oxysporum]